MFRLQIITLLSQGSLQHRYSLQNSPHNVLHYQGGTHEGRPREFQTDSDPQSISRGIPRPHVLDLACRRLETRGLVITGAR